MVILDGVTQQVIFSIQPFEDGFTGGINVSAGDLTGDGIADLVITPDNDGGPRVRVFNGKTFTQLADFFDHPPFILLSSGNNPHEQAILAPR